jgi:dihydrofolate synthase/folylpolyglutamate synthase
MTYQQTLDYLFAKLPMYSRIGGDAFKASLDNIIHLCHHLDNPQEKFKSIHIAGTNGKGSVSHTMAAVLQTAGYKTGLYTSPHLYDFRERIKINGEMVPETFVTRFTGNIQSIIEEISPSFFEITVAMALQFFAEENVDVAVIEVGLGGRLDSTNIITPVLSLITNISYDHTNMLGNTLEEIATEKGGIIKQNIPLIVGQKQPETEPVFKSMAQQKGAEILFAEENFSVTDYKIGLEKISIKILDIEEQRKQQYELDLPGIYQTKNIISVLQAINVLRKKGFTIIEEAVKKGLKNVKTLTGLYGRWEVIGHQPTIVLEVAHNEDGIRQMLEHLTHVPFNHLHLIMGMVKDKEISNILSLLPPDAAYYFTQAHIPRALAAALLQEEAKKFNLIGELFEDVNRAIQKAKSAAQQDDLIIVCGSIFLVAEVNREK